MERLLRAVVNSWNGLRFALRSEAAFRQELAIFVPAVPLAFVITEDGWKRLALIGVLLLLFVVELLNTAIEKLCDRINLEIDPQIGRVKDMGSAAVGVTLLVVRWSMGKALRRMAQWLRDLRIGNGSTASELPKEGIFQPLASEVTRLAFSLKSARAAAEEEARLRDASLSEWTNRPASPPL